MAMPTQLHDLLVVYSAYLLLTASPGPANLSIMALSMAHGRRAGLAMAFGVVMGSFTWAILAACGVSALLAAYADLLIAIKVIGGVYLVYLGIRFGRSAIYGARLDGTTANPQQGSFKQLFLRGYFLHLTNPKAIIGWTALIALGLKPSAGVEMIFEIICGCLVIGSAVFGTYAVIFSSTPVIRGYSKAKRAIESILAGFFIFAGLKMLTQKLR